MHPDELDEYHTGAINETVASVFEGKHPRKNISSCAMLEPYEETPIFIAVDITKESVELVAHNLLGDYSPGGTDLNAQQGWILKLGQYKTTY